MSGDDSVMSNLHLWTGGETLIPVRSEHNWFENEPDLLSSLSKLLYILPSNLTNLTQLKDIEWLTIIPLIDPHCAVALKPDSNWRLVGNIMLTKLLQHDCNL